MTTIISDNIISSLGFTTEENFSALTESKSGLKIVHDPEISPTPIPLSLIDNQLLTSEVHNIPDFSQYTRFEQLMILSITDALKTCPIDITSPETLLLISTTKGNINLIERPQSQFGKDRLFLWRSAEIIAHYFQHPNRPVIISNACISGLSGIIAAKRLLDGGHYKHSVIAGGDQITEFVVSGFQSFKAISAEPCKPFDADRTGISIGEGFATLIISNDPSKYHGNQQIIIAGGASSNDANHISGPSRTGDGLYFSIAGAMNEAKLRSCDIDFVSAHGTATPYNDEMEAKALSLSGLTHSYVNSLKGYFGHTLGAAGVIESIVTIHSLRENRLIQSLGYEKHGVSVDLNIIRQSAIADLKCGLKTGSGFGGCNAAVVFKKKEKYDRIKRKR